jgi:hypothetical protein
MEKIKKFRSGGSEWGRCATAADVMDAIGARIVVADLSALCRVRECSTHLLPPLPAPPSPHHMQSLTLSAAPS